MKDIWFHQSGQDAAQKWSKCRSDASPSVPISRFEAIGLFWGGNWATLGTIWATLGANWTTLGANWVTFGRIWAPFWSQEAPWHRSL